MKFRRKGMVLRLGVFLFLLGPKIPLLQAQLSTSDHLADPGFWPTKDGEARSDYVGPSVCASCHEAKAASQKTTPMAQSLHAASESEVLHAHPGMNFSVRKYKYKIETSTKGSLYQVTDGTDTLKASLIWAFGTGKVGQSYIFKKPDGNFYEARVTYFETLHNLDFTPTRALENPRNLKEAMDRQVGSDEIGRCFACHTTAANVAGKLDEEKAVPGITCEACHGGGAKHVAAAEAAQMAGLPEEARGTIFNPAQLMAIDSVDFCGACHGTFWDVKLSGAKGVATVKAQPYRLESSKCFRKPGNLITCVACHDPHEILQTKPSAYDGACLKCHAAEKPADVKNIVDHTRTCPVSASKCVTCHMPKVYVPEMHYSFTDHRIRIVRSGEAYPE
jgi:hypothetical protein